MLNEINELLDEIWRFKLDYFDDHIIRPEDERLKRLFEKIEGALEDSKNEIDFLTDENKELEDELDKSDKLVYLIDDLRDLINEYED